MRIWQIGSQIAAVALVLLCLSLPAAAQDRVTLGWGRILTNDILGDGRDRWRTGSYTVSRMRGPDWTGHLPTQPGALLEFRLRGEAIAPADLVTPDADDRPYAGVLALGLHSHFDLSGVEASLGMDVVVTGPQNGIGAAQRRLHGWLDLPPPRVLRDQIANDSHIVVSTELGRSLALAPAVTLRPFVAAQLGEETLLRGGVDLTIGQFAKGGLMLRETVTGQRYRAIAGDRIPGMTFVAGADATRVFDSIYLPDTGPAHLAPVRYRLRAGVMWQGKRVDLFSGLTWLSPEFDGQDQGQVVGSVGAQLRF